MKCISGITSFSSQPTVSCRGNPLRRSAPDDSSPDASAAKGFRRQADVGIDDRPAAGYRASWARIQHACCFPHQPGGSSSPGTSRTLPSSRERSPDDRGRRVLGPIVEHQDLDLDPPARERGGDRRPDHGLLVPRRGSTPRPRVALRLPSTPGVGGRRGGCPAPAAPTPGPASRRRGRSRRGGRSFGRIPPVGAVGRSNASGRFNSPAGGRVACSARKVRPPSQARDPPPGIINAADPGCPLDQGREWRPGRVRSPRSPGHRARASSDRSIAEVQSRGDRLRPFPTSMGRPNRRRTSGQRSFQNGYSMASGTMIASRSRWARWPIPDFSLVGRSRGSTNSP